MEELIGMATSLIGDAYKRNLELNGYLNKPSISDFKNYDGKDSIHPKTFEIKKRLDELHGDLDNLTIAYDFLEGDDHSSLRKEIQEGITKELKGDESFLDIKKVIMQELLIVIEKVEKILDEINLGMEQ